MLEKYIHVFGCSFSRDSSCREYPFTDGVTYCWAEHMQKAYPDHGVINWANIGNSNTAILVQVEQVLRDFAEEDNTVIVQFTRKHRQTFINHKLNLAEKIYRSQHTDLKNTPYREIEHQVNVSFDFNPQGFVSAIPGMVGVRRGELAETYANNLQYLIEQQDPYADIHQLAIELHVKWLCDQAGVPSILYSHIRPQHKYTEHLAFSAELDWPGDIWEYAIDEGMHLNAQGHQILFEHFIQPRLEAHRV